MSHLKEYDILQMAQIAIEVALDHKPSHREMTSILISDLYGHVLKQRDIALGEYSSFTFYHVLNEASTVRLSNPLLTDGAIFFLLWKYYGISTVPHVSALA
jgi:hypothetical protein